MGAALRARLRCVLPRPLHPIDVVGRALAQKNGDLLAQFLQAPVALGQFLRGVLVVDSLDQRG